MSSTEEILVPYIKRDMRDGSYGPKQIFADSPDLKNSSFCFYSNRATLIDSKIQSRKFVVLKKDSQESTPLPKKLAKGDESRCHLENNVGVNSGTVIACMTCNLVCS